MPDSPTRPLDLPRNQAGPNPQHLLVTLLGDYWHGRVVAIPSAALVELLGQFDITPTSARSTLSRLARRGILELLRDGRTTSYRVQQHFLNAGESRGNRILQFGQEPSQSWDGRWLIVTFSIPDENRRGREALRTQLRSWGFAPLQDGLWVAVRANEQEVRAGLQELGLEGVAAFSSKLIHPMDPAARQTLVDWPLDRIGQLYDEFADRHDPVRQRLALGVIAPTEALVVRTQIMDEWRTLVSLDPDLPADLLPLGWPRNRARATFVELYDGMGPLAELRCRQIVGAHDPDLVTQTSHITTQLLDAAEVEPDTH